MNKILEKVGNKKFNIFVEGNIGAGKTTLINKYLNGDKFNVTYFHDYLLKFEELKNCSLPQMLYTNPQNWIFPYHSFMLLKMFKAHEKRIEESIKIMERSVFSLRYCFLEAQRFMNHIDPPSFEILKEMYEFLLRHSSFGVQLIIYLRTTPDILIERMRLTDKDFINPQYINILHFFHEKLFDPAVIKNSTRIQYITLNGNQSPDEIVAELESKLEVISTKLTLIEK